MRPEARDTFLAYGDITAKALGGSDFQAGIELARKALTKAVELLNTVRTPELLRQSLDDLNIPPEWENLMIQTAENGPQLLRWLAMKANESAEKSLPALPHRGPAVSGRNQVEILRYINKLEFEQGVRREIAKRRAAQRFQCSVRTVERYWKDRERILANGPKYHFYDLLDELRRTMEEDGAPFLTPDPNALTAPSDEASSRDPEAPVL